MLVLSIPAEYICLQGDLFDEWICSMGGFVVNRSE